MQIFGVFKVYIHYKAQEFPLKSININRKPKRHTIRIRCKVDDACEFLTYDETQHRSRMSHSRQNC